MSPKYAPLSRISEDDADSDFSTEPKHALRHDRGQWSLYLALICTSLGLILTNVLWISHYHHINSISRTTESPSASYWPESATIISKPIHWHTPFSEDSKTATKALWRDLFPIGQGVVYLENEFAFEEKLPASSRNANNASESTYFVAAYHQLHCLSVIRSALYKYREGRNEDVKWDHTIHCLDSLRQSTMCRADDTLLYTNDGTVFGDGQVRKCRDWDGLRRWVEERHA